VIWFGLQTGSGRDQPQTWSITRSKVSEFTLKAGGREGARAPCACPGEHNVRNALAAAAAALQMGLPFDEIAAGISAVEAFRHAQRDRRRPGRRPRSSTIANNANRSMREGCGSWRAAARRAASRRCWRHARALATRPRPTTPNWARGLGKLAPMRAWVVGEHAQTGGRRGRAAEVTAVADRAALEHLKCCAWLKPGDTLLVQACGA